MIVDIHPLNVIPFSLSYVYNESEKFQIESADSLVAAKALSPN